MKKILKSLLVLAIILATCIILNPTKAQAATVDDMTFTLNDDGASYRVRDCKTSASGSLSIPSTYNGKPVTMIGGTAFEDCINLTSVTIPDSVTEISVYAFRRCDGLTSVTIGNKVKKIGISAFSSCDSLKTINIPNSVTTIGDGAFRFCSSLDSIILPDSITTISEQMFGYCDSLTSVTIPASVTAIEEMAFTSCESLTTVVIGSAISRNTLTIGKKAFFSCKMLSNLTLESNVISIGEDAFSYCEALTNVTIPDNVTTIEKDAFYHCSNLNSITLGKSVTTIGESAFSNCVNLSGIFVSSENPKYSSDNYGVLYSKDKTTLIAAPNAIASYTIPIGVTAIGDYAFYYCANLADISISNTVMTIGESAFAYSSLTSVTLSEGVTTIGESAFSHTPLLDVTIPNSVTTIGGSAFSYCTSLTKITIPNSVATIGGSAFYACSKLADVYITDLAAWCRISFSSSTANPLYQAENLYLNGALITDLVIPDGITSINSSAFAGCDSLNSVNIPEGTTTIGSSAFSNCKNLTSVIVPAGVSTIDSFAFSNCESLTSITLPDSVVTIAEKAFYHCVCLTNVILGNNVDIGLSAFEGCTSLVSVKVSDTSETVPGCVAAIGREAFYECENLVSITIPAAVTSIGYEAFGYCASLRNIVIPDNVTTIEHFVFHDCSDLVSVSISAGVTAIGDSAFSNCSGLMGIWVDGNNPAYSSDSYGVLFNKDKTNLIAAPNSLTSYVIPNSVKTISGSAFYGCTNLVGITIPSSVTVIDSHTFFNCRSLSNLVIPSGITTIGDSAFSGCNSLIDLVLPDSITTIERNAFYGCDNLRSVTLSKEITIINDNTFGYCRSLTSVVIPEKVTSIGGSAFADCDSLTTVTMGNKVTKINNAAFASSGLTDIYYGGTESQWNSIDKGTYGFNDYLQKVTIHYLGNCVAYGHTVEIIFGKQPTATESGLTDGQKCSLCQEILVAQQMIPAIGNDHTHAYTNDSDAVCDGCGFVRQMVDTYVFENYRVVFADSDTTHKNLRVEVYNLRDKTVVDPSDEKVLKVIDATPVTHWGASNINKILLTDAGNYVLLLKYNVGTGSATKVPMVLSVSADPKLIINKNNKLTALDNNSANINHRAVVYYLGDQTVEDIYDETALKAIDSAPETVWQKTRINKLALTKGGNYVLHLCYNAGTGSKRTVAQQFTVESIPTLSVDINNRVVVTEENPENRNHRAIAYYLGTKIVTDPYDETEVKAAAVSTSYTYWGISEIGRMELKEGGNYVVHLYYNVGTSEKRTLALEVAVNERPALSVDENGKLTVSYSDAEITNPRAYIYNVGDAEIADIYDEAALKKIATPTQVWGLSSINKKTLTPGTYVIHFYYSVGTSAKKTVALKVTI